MRLQDRQEEFKSIQVAHTGQGLDEIPGKHHHGAHGIGSVQESGGGGRSVAGEGCNLPAVGWWG